MGYRRSAVGSLPGSAANPSARGRLGAVADGYRARQFVVEKMKNLKSVVLKTYRPDKYGRYLADLYYLPKESDPQTVAQEGRFLNQELLDEGLAGKYSLG